MDRILAILSSNEGYLNQSLVKSAYKSDSKRADPTSLEFNYLETFLVWLKRDFEG